MCHKTRTHLLFIVQRCMFFPIVVTAPGDIAPTLDVFCFLIFWDSIGMEYHVCIGSTTSRREVYLCYRPHLSVGQ